MFGGDIFDPFAKLQTQMKVKNENVCIDNWIFFLHRKLSRNISFIALLIISSYTAVIEQPIVCFGPSTDEVPKQFLEEWCWLSGTYIVPQHIDKKKGVEVAISGVGPDDLVGGTTQRLYHNEYIFYPIIFMFQFCSFLGIKFVWKLLEGERLKQILSEMRTAIVDADTMRKRINDVTDYMTTPGCSFFNSYAYKYIFCEMLNFSNIILQFLALDKILHNDFIGYGWNAIAYIKSLQEPNEGTPVKDPFTKMFPKNTLCHFTKSGPSGNPIPLEAYCVLPLNNFADKIFLVWWFWLALLGLITIGGLIYRAVVVFVPCARYWVLRMKIKGCDPTELKYFVNHSTYGDWFVVSLMHKNMSPWTFKHMMRELVMKMKERKVGSVCKARAIKGE